eukprot:3838501-Pleurochrysis_carterae.AAC.2
MMTFVEVNHPGWFFHPLSAGAAPPSPLDHPTAHPSTCARTLLSTDDLRRYTAALLFPRVPTYLRIYQHAP